jgi:GTPase involved in cell partitioning and DNA repair
VPSPSVRRPTGGNGGAGGNVYIIADNSLAHLSLQRAHFNAGNGTHGGGLYPLFVSDSEVLVIVSGDGMTGKRGEDAYIKVPRGTIVSERLSNSQLLGELEADVFGNDPEAYDIDPPSIDLDEHGKCILVARGGKPGLGNKALSGGKGKLFRSVVRSLCLLSCCRSSRSPSFDMTDEQ